MSDFQSALEGIRILDFSHVFQGPVGTQLLADFGAQVIKIERPGMGDWSRSWGPFVEGMSMPYACLNRNKKSLALDVKSQAGKRIVRQLVQISDILIHNFRPGVMEKLGLGYEDLRQLNPRIIYAYSSGWGDEGPYVDRGKAGHDLLARAAAGWFEHLIPGKPPVAGGISVDYPAGLILTIGILIALQAREHTGVGQIVSTDLFSTAFHCNSWYGGEALNKELNIEDSGTGVTEKAIKKAFFTLDGLIEISPVFSPNPLRDISVAMGLGDLSKDPRFLTESDQFANQEELNTILAECFQQKTTQEWISILEPKGVLCGEINTFEQASKDPQIKANKMVIEMEHERTGKLRLIGTPLRLSDAPASHRTPPAYLGEDNAEVLTELGYSNEEIEQLIKDGVLG